MARSAGDLLLYRRRIGADEIHARWVGGASRQYDEESPAYRWACQYGSRDDGISPKMGRGNAHDKISAICIALAQGKARLIDLLEADPEISKILNRHALETLLDPTNYVGNSGAMVDRVLNDRKG